MMRNIFFVVIALLLAPIVSRANVDLGTTGKFSKFRVSTERLVVDASVKDRFRGIKITSARSSLVVSKVRVTFKNGVARTSNLRHSVSLDRGQYFSMSWRDSRRVQSVEIMGRSRYGFGPSARASVELLSHVPRAPAPRKPRSATCRGFYSIDDQAYVGHEVNVDSRYCAFHFEVWARGKRPIDLGVEVCFANGRCRDFDVTLSRGSEHQRQERRRRDRRNRLSLFEGKLQLNRQRNVESMTIYESSRARKRDFAITGSKLSYRHR